jgi:saccharopine dehydrogenase-like NADP-dependent oxidoreductase
MFAVRVVGAGRTGASIEKPLHNTVDNDITVADHDDAALERSSAAVPVRILNLDVEFDIQRLTTELRTLATGRRAAVFRTCSHDVNRLIALSALKAGVSYFDLTEDVETTRRVRLASSEFSAFPYDEPV